MNDPVVGLGLIAFALLLLVLPLSFWSLSGGRNSSVVRLLVAAANLCLTAQLVLRWWDSGHFPISNLYESLCFLAWGCTLTQLLVERSWPSPLVPAAATPIGAGLCGLCQFCPAGHPAAGIPPGPGTALQLAGDACERDHAQLRRPAGGIPALPGGSVRRSGDQHGAAQQLHRQRWTFARPSWPLPALRMIQLSSSPFQISEQLDSLSYRTITVGFLLLSVGLVSGAVWANEAWGSWWSWDPKETWALICWLVYAAYLHTRLIRGWQGRKPALVASAGLVVIAVCYIGVNLLGIGLHSYGWFFES